MPGTKTEMRFDAQTVGRLLTVSEGKRFEMHLRDSDGRQIVVSMPAPVAVQMGCMICDVSEHAPFLIGGATGRRSSSGSSRSR